MKEKKIQRNKKDKILFITIASIFFVAVSIYLFNRFNQDSVLSQSSIQKPNKVSKQIEKKENSSQNFSQKSSTIDTPSNLNKKKLASNPVIRVYRTPYCGCCKNWVAYMKESGFQIDDRVVQDLEPVNKELGVPKPFESCHTAWIQGYFVEGHVPSEDIVRLLEEKPNIKGLAVPGMPIGSPGMEQGNQRDSYIVWAFDGKESYPFSSYQP